MAYLISAVWIFATILSYFIWTSAFFTCRHTNKVRNFTFFLDWLFCYLIANLNTIPGLNILMTSLLFVCTSLFLFRAPWYMHLLISIFSVLIIALCETAVFYFFASAFHMSFSELVPHEILYTMIGMTAYALSVAISWSVYRLRHVRREQTAATPSLLLGLLFPMTSAVSLWFIFVSNQDRANMSVPIFLFALIHGAANAALYYLIHLIEKQSAQAHEQDLLKQQMHIQSESIAALEQNYRAQRASVHNFQNQLQTIHDLLATGETDRVAAYIEQLQGIQTSRIFAIHSHHPTIDAVLNQKYQTAKENGIDFQVKVNDLSGVEISTDSLIVILSNLLDNALDACRKVSGPRILQLTFLAEESVYLSIRNTSQPITILNGEIRTTKFPSQNHGFGLPCVRRLLTELKAEYTIQYENGWFQFAAEIPVSPSPSADSSLL